MNNSKPRFWTFTLSQRITGLMYRLKSRLAIEPCGYCGYADDPDVICHVCFHSDGVKTPGAARRFFKSAAQYLNQSRMENELQSSEDTPSSIKVVWVLKLREEMKTEQIIGTYYFSLFGSAEGFNWITPHLEEAEQYDVKEAAIQEMKDYEALLLDAYGSDAPIIFGYTSTMKYFEFIEVTIAQPSSVEMGGGHLV